MGEEVTYPTLTLLVLAGFAVFWILNRKLLTKRALAISTLVMLTLTAVFDNVIIGTGIVAYDETKLLGLKLGFAPIEDFAYTVVALVLVPVLYERFSKK